MTYFLKAKFMHSTFISSTEKNKYGLDDKAKKSYVEAMSAIMNLSPEATLFTFCAT